MFKKFIIIGAGPAGISAGYELNNLRIKKNRKNILNICYDC